MNNLFLDLNSTDTFDTALERLEEYGVDSLLFTVNNKKGKPTLFLCLSRDPNLADRIGNTVETYSSGQDEV